MISLCYILPVTAPIVETGRGDPMDILQSFALSVLDSVVPVQVA